VISEKPGLIVFMGLGLFAPRLLRAISRAPMSLVLITFALPFYHLRRSVADTQSNLKVNACTIE
jgi:hypothetical protein